MGLTANIRDRVTEPEQDQPPLQFWGHSNLHSISVGREASIASPLHVSETTPLEQGTFGEKHQAEALSGVYSDDIHCLNNFGSVTGYLVTKWCQPNSALGRVS